MRPQSKVAFPMADPGPVPEAVRNKRSVRYLEEQASQHTLSIVIGAVFVATLFFFVLMSMLGSPSSDQQVGQSAERPSSSAPNSGGR